MNDPLNTVQPGQQMSAEEKKAVADANAKISAEAHEMAARRRSQDDLNQPPLVQVLADSIKDKLKKLPPEEGSTN